MKIKSAEKILEKNMGHAYGLTNIMHIKAMKEYAQQFIQEAAELVNSWENSGQMRENLLEELNPKNI